MMTPLTLVVGTGVMIVNLFPFLFKRSEYHLLTIIISPILISLLRFFQ